MPTDKEASPRPGRVGEDGNVEREAEEALLSILEKRRQRERPPLAKKREAESERDVLPGVPSEASAIFDGVDASKRSAEGSPEHSRIRQPKTRPSLASAAQRVVHISRIKRLQEVIGDEGSSASTRKLHDIKAPTTTFSPLHEVGTHVQRGSCADLLFDELRRVEEMHQHETQPPIDENEEAPLAKAVSTRTPYLSTGFGSSQRSTASGNKPAGIGLGVSFDEETGEKNEASSLLPKSELHHSNLMRFRSAAKRSPFRDVLGLRIICKNFFHFFATRFLLVMCPCLAAAYFLYRYGNIELEFLPSDATLSWWLIFLVRQLVTLQLAICTEYMVVDVFVLRSAVASRVMGPLLTLYTMQAKGWPFIISCWGVWDLLLLHGNSAFAQNWLFWLNIGMFSDDNPDGGVVASDLYLRMLLSIVFTGVSVGIKRTYLALALGRRTFLHYKGRLEMLLGNIVLLSEISDIAALTESPAFEAALAATGEEPSNGTSKLATLNTQQSKKWDKIKFNDSDSDSDSGSVNGSEIDLKDTSDKSAFRAQYLQHKSSRVSSAKIKDLLDRWEEPQNKQKKDSNASIHDILQFRKALAYMDDSHPFSNNFGPSDTRDRCIKSAMNVYDRLLKFTPESDVLPFEVLAALAYDEEGNISDTKKQSLEKLFRPDRHNRITRLAFVQTCDWVYKKLRFFRASVANSSLIDGVLEQIFNFFFYVILTLVIVSGIMNLDPYSLFLSVSTLLVSFSFAVGSSVSKLIEGILLIAVRRPFDLGDRISLSPADAANTGGSLAQAWFVEDVNLFTTTLRFTATNEVSTVNNGAIANSRIVNFARSPGALVALDLLFAIQATHEQMGMFKEAVTKYIRDNPRTWSTLIHFRTTQIDPDMEFVGTSLCLRHMKSWQETPLVLDSRSDLYKFCIQAMEQLGIAYDSPGRTFNINMRSPVNSLSGEKKADDQKKQPSGSDEIQSVSKDKQ